MPEVLNKNKGGTSLGAVYIGRPSPWGNPFHIGQHGTREDVISMFEDYIYARPDMMEQARKQLAGKDLVCYCAPLACHGDILLKIANP